MKEIQRDTHFPENEDPPDVHLSDSPQDTTEQASEITKRFGSEGSAAQELGVNDKDNREGRNIASPSQKHDASNTGNVATMVSDDALRDLFSEDDSLYILVTQLIKLLQKVQKKANLEHRLHLFVESDRGFAGGVQEGSPEVMHRIQTRLAFSPTLSSSDGQQQSGLARIYGELSHLSFEKAPSGSSYVSGVRSDSEITPPLKQSVPRRITLPSGTHTPQRATVIRNKAHELQWPVLITTEFHLNFPKWCPFTPENSESGYTKPPQNSKDHHLVLEKESLGLFKNLQDFQVMWIYQELFLYMHRQGRILERSGQVVGMAKSIKYSQFTPPWIRLNIAVKLESSATGDGEIEAFSETVTLKKAGVTDLRKERNTQGYRRLRFILAAFHSEEPKAVKPLLQYLLSIVPVDRAHSRRKPRRVKRKANNDNVISLAADDRPDAEQKSKRMKAADSPDVSMAPEMNTDISRDSSFPRPHTSAQDRSNAKQLPRSQEYQHQKPKSVFDGLTERPPDRRESSREYEQTLAAAVTLLNKDGKGTRRGPVGLSEGKNASKQGSHAPNKDPHVLAHSREAAPATPSDPLTPFSSEASFGANATSSSEDSIEVHEDVDGSEDELENDPFSGVIKCGALAQCHWFLLPERQDPKTMSKKCIKCQVPMHAQCSARVGSVCDVCAKKDTFAKIYEEERRANM